MGLYKEEVPRGTTKTKRTQDVNSRRKARGCHYNWEDSSIYEKLNYVIFSIEESYDTEELSNWWITKFIVGSWAKNVSIR